MKESVSLAFNDLAQGGSSDKVYHLDLSEDESGWSVTGQYGRRGSALMSQTKAKGVDLEKAKKIFDKVKREKIGKGYRVEGTAPAPQVAPSGLAIDDIKPPELLEEVVNGDHLAYIDDHAYWMQDKSDGVSRGVLKRAGEIFGINKRGLPVPLPAELITELARLPLDTFQIDAELVGAKLVCRDLLVADRDISEWPYEERFACLLGFFTFYGAGGSVVAVTTWRTHAEKVAAIAQSLADRREGVVFKLRSAPYRAGRNGQHKKYKFIKTLSAIAGKPGATGKESVELFLIQPLPGHSFGPKIRVGTVSLIGKPKVQEDDVVEVAYLYAQPSNLMSQARLLHVRTDVAIEECTTRQLIYKREEEE